MTLNWFKKLKSGLSKSASKVEGAIASIATGASVTIVWTFFLPRWPEFVDLSPFLKELTYPAATLSVLALVVVSLFTPAPKNEDLNQFFDETNQKSGIENF